MNENKARSRLDQRRAPIYEALERFRQMRVVPFDVPGHKRGRGNPELAALRAMPNVILTDHTAFYTYEDVKSMVRGVLESAAAFAEGSPSRHDVTNR